MKRSEKKKLKKLQDEVVKYQMIGELPLIRVNISMKDGAKVDTSAIPIKLLVDAVGEERGINWHAHYMQEFKKLTDECWNEYTRIIQEAKEEKGNKMSEASEQKAMLNDEFDV